MLDAAEDDALTATAMTAVARLLTIICVSGQSSAIGCREGGCFHNADAGHGRFYCCSIYLLLIL